MDRLIRASLIASIVTIGGNMQNGNEKVITVTEENARKINEDKVEVVSENKNKETELKNKNKKKFDKESSFVKFITCDNCFRGFGDKKTKENKS